MNLKRWFGLSALALLTLLLSACGGGGGGGASTTMITGTAATGAAIDGMVEAINANGVRSGLVQIDPDGGFEIEIEVGGPYLLRALGSDGVTELYSIAFGNGDVIIANITELTDLALGIAALRGANLGDDEDPFGAWRQIAGDFNEAAINDALARVNANFAGLLGDRGFDPFTFDFLRTPFNVGDDFDGLLDAILSIDFEPGEGDSFTITVSIDGEDLLEFEIEINIEGFEIGGDGAGNGGGGGNGQIAGTWSLEVSGTVGGVAIPPTTQPGIQAVAVPASQQSATQIAQGNISADVQGQDISVNFTNLNVTYTPDVSGAVGDKVTVRVTGNYIVTLNGQTLPATTIDLTYVWTRTS